MYDGDYWLSSRCRIRRGTCWVRADQNIIVDTAPLWRKFIGQPMDNLTNWLFYFEIAKLEDSDEIRDHAS